MATILVADDEEMVRNLVCSILHKEGHRYFEAANGLEAVALFRSNARLIDLVITDLRMPVMGGVEAIARIRETRADVPIICITGFTDERVPPDTALVKKPFKPQQLCAEVNRALRP